MTTQDKHGWIDVGSSSSTNVTIKRGTLVGANITVTMVSPPVTRSRFADVVVQGVTPTSPLTLVFSVDGSQTLTRLSSLGNYTSSASGGSWAVVVTANATASVHTASVWVANATDGTIVDSLPWNLVWTVDVEAPTVSFVQKPPPTSTVPASWATFVFSAR